MHGMEDSFDYMIFTSSSLSRITASTLIVDGDCDPLSARKAVDMYRAIPQSGLGWRQSETMGRGLDGTRHGPAISEVRRNRSEAQSENG